MTLRPLIAGNWKMNGLTPALSEALALKDGIKGLTCEVLLCPPATLIAPMADLVGEGFAVGGQDCHAEASGAHTGDISAEMIADAGGAFVIVGHSERRADHGESDALVRSKAEAGHRAGLTAIVCVGETEAERDAGRALEVVLSQIDASVPQGATAADTVIAYEPVWAIGTGRTPSEAEIAEVHDAIRARISSQFGTQGEAMRLLYGGSMKPANAGAILSLENVNGGLVGGASLKASDFAEIARAAG